MTRNLWWRRREPEPVRREELAALLPDPGDPLLPAGRRALLEEHLMSEIHPETTSAPAGRPYRRRLALLATPLAVAAVAAGGFAIVGQSSSPDGTAAEAPSLTLEQAARRVAAAAASDTVPPPRPDQYVYGESRGVALAQSVDATGESTYELMGPNRQEAWLSPDGWDGRALELLHDRDCPLPVGSRWDVSLDEVGVVTMDCEWDAPADEGNPNPTEPSRGSYDWLALLPTEPGALLDRLYEVTEGEGDSPADGVFQAIAAMTAESLAPPDVAAALYRVAAALPGAELVDDAVDAEGRAGFAIARVEGETRTELIFDAASYAYLGYRAVLTEAEDNLPEGSVLWGTAVLERAVVDAMGERPAE